MEIETARRRGTRWRLSPIGFVWTVAAVFVAAYAAHQAFGLGGRGVDGFFDDWVNDGLLWCAAVVCIAGGLRANQNRAAWVLAGLALACWAVGDTISSVRFGQASPPPTSISDVFWLAWYPLIVAALVLLVRERVPGFELHRWIDGVAVMLLLATPWVALFLEPVAEHSDTTGLAIVLDFAYPLGDAILVGAVLGVYVLMDWRPGRMWLVLGIALAIMGVTDASYSVAALAHSHDRGIYDAPWVGAAMLVAYAAWQPHPGRLERREVTGWRAIALAVAAQALAISIQIYAIFDEIPRSERILTAIVLIIATIQIILGRPRARARSALDAQPGPAGSSSAVPEAGRAEDLEASTASPQASQL